jgi:hemerythrin-like domain-containing protein
MWAACARAESYRICRAKPARAPPEITMTDKTLQAALESEHRQIDGGIEAFVAQLASGQRELAPLLRALEGLRRHIYLEEEFLFPPLRKAGLMVPILVMLREHGELWRSMSRLDELLATNAAADVLSAACAELLAKLDAHNSKEEPIIYTRADQALDDEAAAELSAFLDTGVLPDDWICSGARN